MSALKHLAMWSALVMMMGHMLVPHHHCATAEATWCDARKHPSSSPLDVLAGVFDTDLGEDHLEHFDLPLAERAALHASDHKVFFALDGVDLTSYATPHHSFSSAMQLHGERGPPAM